MTGDVTRHRRELQEASERVAALRREADLAAAVLPDLAERALEEQRTAAAAGNGAEAAMAEELPAWQAEWDNALSAARSALLAFVAVSDRWNERVDRFRRESAGTVNAGGIGQRGPVTKSTAGLWALLLAADAIEAARDDESLSKPYVSELRFLRTNARRPRCTLDR